MLKNHGLFRRAPELVNGVVQHMDVCYLDDFSRFGNNGNFASLKKFAMEYKDWYSRFAKVAEFGSGEPNSLGLHFYPQGMNTSTHIFRAPEIIRMAPRPPTPAC